MEHLIPDIAAMLGLEPTTALFFWLVILFASNAISRLIPEDAEGALKYVRKATAFLGIHVKNRVHHKITPEALTQVLVREAERRVDETVPVVRGAAQEALDQVITTPIVPPAVAAYLQSQLPPINETDYER